MIKDKLANILYKLRHNKAYQITLILLIIAAGVFIILTFDLNQAQAFIRAHRQQAVFISIGVYLLLGFTFIPASPLTLFLAVFLGPIETVVVATVGNTLAALLEYQIGVTVGDIFNIQERMKRLPFRLGELPINSPYVLLVGRVTPFGKQPFSIVCGAYQVPLGKYLWTSAVMFFFNAAVLAFSGAGLVKLLQSLFA
ncbi:MAG: TVP38/TMEM64 family protein [Brevefilum sp.]